MVLLDKSILVTGGTGSFGKAFVRRALADGAGRVVVYSRGELLQAQMREEYADPRLRFFIGDVRDRRRLDLAMAGVDYCIHAAALKRIEVCEENPLEAKRTNVDGTENVALSAIGMGVHKAVLLSTDKAPVPHTTYGATKMLAERLWLQSNVYAAGTGTILTATRYGNVLASRGSVLHTWRSQAAAGQPLTVTSSGMSRYWMTLDQAVDLVLLALLLGRGGEVFVPKIPSAPLLTLVEAVAPGASITETGLRGAERMHETLISADEAANCYDCGDHYMIWPEYRSWGAEPEPLYPKVPDGWSYRSDTNERQYTVEQLARLIA
jgi:UDP-N-acetylglucosamine 4,6-dehydratase